MKKLLLIRHGKSSWKDSRLADLERPLKKRGRRNAVDMAQRLVRLDYKPERVFCSPASRTTETLRIMARTTGFGARITEINSDLYVFDVGSLLHWLRDREECFDNIAIVGHNPALTELVNSLSGESIDNLPTCGMALLELEVAHWRELAPGRGRLTYFDYPKKPVTKGAFAAPDLITEGKENGG